MGGGPKYFAENPNIRLASYGSVPCLCTPPGIMSNTIQYNTKYFLLENEPITYNKIKIFKYESHTNNHRKL